MGDAGNKVANVFIAGERRQGLPIDVAGAPTGGGMLCRKVDFRGFFPGHATMGDGGIGEGRVGQVGGEDGLWNVV